MSTDPESGRTHPHLNNDLIILTGSAHPKLAASIGEILGKDVYNVAREPFNDGSPDVRIPTTLRRRDVFVIQPVSPPDLIYQYEELKDILDATKRVGGANVTAVVPYFPYARSDRMNRQRAPISGARAAREIVEAGADHILTVDLHSEQLMGTIHRYPWDNVYASYCLVPEIKKLGLDNVVVASPDRGGSERAFKYRDFFDPQDEIAIFYKVRHPETRLPTIDKVVGDVEGKNVIFVDDILDTGGTLVGAANHAFSKGAKSVRAMITHGLFTGGALKKVEDSAIERVYTTDSTNLREEIRDHEKVSTHTIAYLVADAIRRIHTGESIQELFLKTEPQHPSSILSMTW